MEPGKIYSRVSSSGKKNKKWKCTYVFVQGNMAELTEMTGWDGHQVLYFGDHPYADLADLSLNYGWRTGAIIQELEDEVGVMNTPEFKWGINWSTTLQHMIEDNQHKQTVEDKETIRKWKEELAEVRYIRDNLDFAFCTKNY